MPACRDDVCDPGLRQCWKFFGLLIGNLALGPMLSGQDAAASVEHVKLPIIRETQESFAGSISIKDYFVRLPEHILFRDGTRVEATLHPSESLRPAVCAIGLAVNDRLVVSTNLHVGGGELRAESVRLNAAVPREALSGGWNRISLRFTLHSAKDITREAMEKMSWTLRSSESFLDLAFERQPLFPELARLPHSLAEEKLLHPDIDAPFADMIQPAVSILVPGRSRQAHLRAAAIVGARLGQVGHLDDAHCRVQALEFWKTETDQRDAVIIARRDQLGGIDLPGKITAAIAELRARQGLLAEFFVGPQTHPHRVLLITGADDKGLEQAALTLGSSPALDVAPPSPSVIEELPSLPASVEAEAAPSPAMIRLAGAPLEWHGLYRGEQSFSGWRLPPGFQAGNDSALTLEYRYAASVVATNSFLEASVNGQRIGTIQLGAVSSTNGIARMTLPTRLPGRDPMILTFRALLDGGEAACGQAEPAQAWFRILPESRIESSPEPAELKGLQNLDRLLTRDRFARRAAFVLPEGPGLGQVRLLFTLAFRLGKQLPSSPVLWPEVVTYRTSGALDTGRLKGRSVVLLGSIAQWGEVLGDGVASPAVSMASAPNAVVIQGREYPMNHFDPALALVQFLPSPWADGEKLVVAGSWQDYTAPTVKRLLRDLASGELEGDLAALTSSGVVVSYNSKSPPAMAFADSIARPQANEPAFAMALPGPPAAAASTQGSNVFLYYACSGVFVLLVAARLLLMWEHARIREKAMAADRTTGGYP
jgi:hypothetical protein